LTEVHLETLLCDIRPGRKDGVLPDLHVIGLDNNPISSLQSIAARMESSSTFSVDTDISQDGLLVLSLLRTPVWRTITQSETEPSRQRCIYPLTLSAMDEKKKETGALVTIAKAFKITLFSSPLDVLDPSDFSPEVEKCLRLNVAKRVVSSRLKVLPLPDLLYCIYHNSGINSNNDKKDATALFCFLRNNTDYFCDYRQHCIDGTFPRKRQRRAIDSIFEFASTIVQKIMKWDK
jgi:hypothetical protein